MWLIDARQLVQEERVSLVFVTEPVPVEYAILSHTWGDGEVSFHEFRPGTHTDALWGKAGFEKIYRTCELALAHDLGYAWVDTCCIDKSSSAELSEAINSMFRWYKSSAVCFVFLCDLHPCDVYDFGEPPEKLDKCRWFTRGWTLQELIAPFQVLFYDAGWNLRGDKCSWGEAIEYITGIDQAVLENSSVVSGYLLGKRMSWAAKRQTTRIEDQAYCLMGIFNVNMPMLYGEGLKAFRRLQEEILRNTTDLSLFAWESHNTKEEYSGILARSPAEFANCIYLLPRRDQSRFRDEITMTNQGVRINNASLEMHSEDDFAIRAAHTQKKLLVTRMDLSCGIDYGNCGTIYPVGIDLRFWRGQYVRHNPGTLSLVALMNDTSSREALCVVSELNELESASIAADMKCDDGIRFFFLLGCTQEPEPSRPKVLVDTMTSHARPSGYWLEDQHFFVTRELDQFTCYIRCRLRLDRPDTYLIVSDPILLAVFIEASGFSTGIYNEASLKEWNVPWLNRTHPGLTEDLGMYHGRLDAWSSQDHREFPLSSVRELVLKRPRQECVACFRMVGQKWPGCSIPDTFETRITVDITHNSGNRGLGLYRVDVTVVDDGTLVAKQKATTTRLSMGRIRRKSSDVVRLKIQAAFRVLLRKV